MPNTGTKKKLEERMPWPDEGFMKGFEEVAGKYFQYNSQLSPRITDKMIDLSGLDLRKRVKGKISARDWRNGAH